MTGCVGSGDVEFTIFSKNVGSMYRWTKEGEVEEIENPLKVGHTVWISISVMRVGSDTFGDPIFQKGLQN